MEFFGQLVHGSLGLGFGHMPSRDGSGRHEDILRRLVFGWLSGPLSVVLGPFCAAAGEAVEQADGEDEKSPQYERDSEAEKHGEDDRSSL